jgi:hydroxymethylbilane synthase
MRSVLAFLDDGDARATTACERALLQGLGGGCQVPIGALAERQDGKLTLTAICGRPDGSELLREQAVGTDPEKLGRQTAETLRKKGADRILNDIYGQQVAVPRQP